jgi:hypothetical protein
MGKLPDSLPLARALKTPPLSAKKNKSHVMADIPHIINKYMYF